MNLVFQLKISLLYSYEPRTGTFFQSMLQTQNAGVKSSLEQANSTAVVVYLQMPANCIW